MSSFLHQQILTVFNEHTSKTLAFRPLSRSDGWALFCATQHPDFNRFLLWDAPSDISFMMPQVDKLLREHQLMKTVALSVVDRDTGTWKGLCLLKGFREGVEMSLYLHPNTWNTGIVFMAGCAVIDLLLKKFPNQGIYNRVILGNKRMRRINLSYGFEVLDTVSDIHQNGEDRKLEVFLLNTEKWKVFDGVGSY